MVYEIKKRCKYSAFLFIFIHFDQFFSNYGQKHFFICDFLNKFGVKLIKRLPFSS